MALLDEVLAQPIGARFFRGDLHIHSFGVSHDVRDIAMTGTAIVATAVREDLAIIAITDHNEIDNVEAALHASQGSSIYVVPGIELSTTRSPILVAVRFRVRG